jgi:MFS family permease
MSPEASGPAGAAAAASPDPAPFAPAERRQLWRFCLYGFLKNQQYYENFFMLALLAKGLSFTQWGLLIGFSKVVNNILEIPAGALADVWGRRRTMIASFVCYIAAFGMLGFSQSYWAFFPAMVLFAGGEAFREGTHKAMIFDWLTRLGRGAEKTRVYGITRSWSKLGSALAVVLAAVILILTRDYKWVFVLTTIPFALGIVNFLFYPKYLDGGARTGRLPGEVARMLWGGLKLAVSKKQLRGLVAESMCFEGVYEAVKDYLQPLVKTVAAAALVWWGLSADKMVSTALLMAVVFLPTNLLASFASRQSHRASASCGGDDRLAFWLWLAALGLYLGIGGTLYLGLGAAAIVGFVILTALQNVWQPTLTSRYYCHAETGSAATTLSIQSQAKGLATAVLAPLLGLIIDLFARNLGATAKTAPAQALWPAAVAGALFCLVGLLVNLRLHRRHWSGAGPVVDDKPQIADCRFEKSEVPRDGSK